MAILKRFIRRFLSFFVFLRYHDFWTIYDEIMNRGIDSGLLPSVHTQYCDDHSAYIGIGAEFKNHPYLPHGLNGIFISDGAKIGKNAIIFQQVTIGSSRIFGSDNNGSPTIGDDVYIGAGAKIIGNITIGNHVRIGANAVVYEDIPDNCVVVPSKTRIIQREEILDNRFVKMSKGKEVYYDFETESFIPLNRN